MPMKRILLLSLFIFGAVILWQSAQRAGPGMPTDQKIAWLTSFPEALKQAESSGRPVMVDFYADWCGPCKMLDRQTYADARVVNAATNWVSAKIDVDANQNLAREYEVSSIPTIVFISPEGKELSRFSGFVPAPEMLDRMNKAGALVGSK